MDDIESNRGAVQPARKARKSLLQPEREWVISKLLGTIGDMRNVTVAQLESEFVAMFPARPPGYLNIEHLNTQRNNIRKQQEALIKSTNLMNETEDEKKLREETEYETASLLKVRRDTAKDRRRTRIANAEKLLCDNTKEVDRLEGQIFELIAEVNHVTEKPNAFPFEDSEQLWATKMWSKINMLLTETSPFAHLEAINPISDRARSVESKLIELKRPLCQYASSADNCEWASQYLAGMRTSSSANSAAIQLLAKRSSSGRRAEIPENRKRMRVEAGVSDFSRPIFAVSERLPVRGKSWRNVPYRSARECWLHRRRRVPLHGGR
jgi:hypothetical protein